MIETLLINANYKEGQNLRLMELWAGPEQSRKGWVMVSEEKGSKKEATSVSEANEA